MNRRCGVCGLFALLGLAVSVLAAEDAARFVEERERMIVNDLQGRDIRDAQVLRQMSIVPRHLFVPPEERSQAYYDGPLPIGHGQTISQPYIVALMTEKLEPKPTDKVLEVGAGSGYQAAVLSGLVAELHTIEIVEPLADAARTRLAELGYKNVTVHTGDGFHGLAAHAPFDAIIVTAAAGQIPPPLVRQLKPGGRMVIPVGPSWSVQQLLKVTKDESGEIRTESLIPVRFVPLTGAH